MAIKSVLHALLAWLQLGVLWRSRHLLASLVKRELGARYAGSVGGWTWVVLRPLVTVLSYYFVFGVVMGLRMDPERIGVTNYPLYLLAGLIPWLALVDAVNPGAQGFVQSRDLVRKSRLPLEMIAARFVGVTAVSYVPVIILLFLVNWVWHGAALVGLALLLPWLAVQLFFSYYLILVVGLLTVALRDIGHLFQMLFGMLVFFAPILYPVTIVPESYRFLLWLNPATPFANGYHAIILQGIPPAGADMLMAAGWILLLLWLARLILGRARELVVDWL